MYQLSLLEGLEFFDHVVLCGSWQDQYCPFDSARIEISKNTREKALGQDCTRSGGGEGGKERKDIDSQNLDSNLPKSSDIITSDDDNLETKRNW